MKEIEEIKLIDSETKNFVKEILFDGFFYDVTKFIQKHPGGNVIEYYTEKGEDSTIAILQFHKRSIEKVKVLLRGLKRRPASDSKIALDPEVINRNRRLTEDFSKLYTELEKEGLFDPSYLHAFARLAELFVLAGVGLSLFNGQTIVSKFVGLIFLMFSRARACFFVHETGHYSYSGNSKVDRIIDCIIHGLFVGLSAARWKRNHNRHHAMPQRLNHDVDIDTMPILAYNVKVAKTSKHETGFMIKHQPYLYVVDTLLVIIVWMMYHDPKYILKRKQYFEMVTLVVHCAFFYQIGFWGWLFTTWVAAFYLFTTFAMSHTFLPVTTEPTHWVEYSFLHTANVVHAPWADWATGYLNYQIEHHMFPTMPNFRLPYIKDRVRALAEKHNLPYIVHSYPDALKKVFKNMSEVAKESSQS